ncbi:MAG TPA: protein kinase [Gemmatimonadales bacterium]|nr:protein kinase [Gemmatimonadales bacterium]
MKQPTLKPGATPLVSFESGDQYQVDGLIGQGGFGSVYRGRAIHLGKPMSPDLCIKITTDVSSWHREAYFGEILRGHAGAVQMHASFVGHQGPRRPLYCSVFELCERSIGGALLDGLRWSETRALREFRSVVRAVADLHASGAVHRDITPRNVLLTFKGHLKLADFGIARHGIAGKVRADAFNPWHAPATILVGKRHWSPREDVWQLGQLLAQLLGARVTRWLRSGDVRRLTSSDRCKALIYRSIGPREYRFQDAGHMLDQLGKRTALKFSRVTGLRGRTVVFTGRGSLKRAILWRRTRRAGGTPVASVSRSVDVVVVGDRSPIWAAGDAGRKILAALQLADEGHKIRFVKESVFLRLASG